MVANYPPKSGYRLAAALQQKPLNRPFFELLTTLAANGQLVSARNFTHFLATPEAGQAIQNMMQEIGLRETGVAYEPKITALQARTAQVECQEGKYDVSEYPRRIEYKSLHKALGDARATTELRTRIPHPPLTEAGKEMRARETGPARLMR